jgi:hypothetical protein
MATRRSGKSTDGSKTLAAAILGNETAILVRRQQSCANRGKKKEESIRDQWKQSPAAIRDPNFVRGGRL